MALTFRDCPYCGRGIVLSLIQSHLIEVHKGELEALNSPPPKRYETAGIEPPRKRKKTNPSKQTRCKKQEPKRPLDPRVYRALKEQELRAQARTFTNVQLTALIRRGKETGKSIVATPNPKDEVRLTIRRIPATKKVVPDTIPAATKVVPGTSPAVSSKAARKPRALIVETKKVSTRPPKYLTISSPCSCQGLNENCFKCGGSGQEEKQIAIEPNSDTTLFPRSYRVPSKVASLAKDSRGDVFVMREKGKFDTRPICDSYGDEDGA